MAFGKLLDRFIEERPVAVMFRAVLERILSASRMNALFDATAVEQYDHRISFAMVVELLGEVVTCQQHSVNSAYATAGRQRVGASVAALYDKLAGVETAVSEQLVRETAGDLAALIATFPRRRKPLLRGYRLRILDGKLPDGTEHRLKETRHRREAVLPGRLCAVLDPESELVLDVVACEDAHASERTLMPRLFAHLQRGDCVIADRNFCTKSKLIALHDAGIKFVMRQHAGDCPVELLGKPRRIGPCATGVVYEQEVRVVFGERTLHLRRITIRLKQPTRDGDKEIHLLSNLPTTIGARKIAELYRGRWKIEQAFQTLAEALRGEVNTLGYPRAALLAYCLALTAFNLLSTVKAAVKAAHKHAPEKLSSFYMIDEVTRAWDGVDLLIEARTWEQQFVEVPLKDFVRKLLRIAKRVNVARFATTTRGPKKPRQLLPRGKSTHLSTYRLLSTSPKRQ